MMHKGSCYMFAFLGRLSVLLILQGPLVYSMVPVASTSHRAAAFGIRSCTPVFARAIITTSLSMSTNIAGTGSLTEINGNTQGLVGSRNIQSDAEVRSVRILALHGKNGSGESFAKSLSPLEEALTKMEPAVNYKFEFDYLTAPFALDEANNSGSGKAWWTLPPGVRSFNAEEYVGFETSAQMVQEALSDPNHPYDFCFGHSQGAILLSALLAKGSLISPRTPFINDKDSEPQVPVGVILNGAAWPNPFTEQLEQLSFLEKDEECKNAPRALFIMGENDTINPVDGACRVRDALQKAGVMVTTCQHDGGHSVPTNNEAATDQITRWITYVTSLSEICVM
uniref:Serine hydrolase domain-containing protein n=1 Tax=Attheya septentrionalis TaxID=420275 RepID=A0A7S2XLF1_9STRA|mmetsp:Transcript_19189/g.34805  ORF Transcript_19189/g.34805 Transcript_19189/m.34805 type:complete len:339 (+) Transcript_19189:52-1068(+)